MPYIVIIKICYQLVQSALKIGSALAKRVGQEEMGGCHPLGDSAWQLLQLGVEKPWLTPGGSFLSFHAQTGGTVGSFQSGGAFTGWRALTIERSLMSGCGQGHQLVHFGVLNLINSHAKTDSSLVHGNTVLPCSEMHESKTIVSQKLCSV